jgi:hypothetical protein
MRRLLPFLVLLILAATACGNDVGDASRTPSATEADEEAVAKASTLQSEDVPAGWKLTPSEGGPDMFGECRGFEDAEDFSTAVTDSPDFDHPGEQFSVLDTVYLFPDEISAKNAFSGMRAADMPRCFDEEMQRFFEAYDVPVEVGKTVGEALDVAKLGDEIHGERVTMPFDDGTEATQISADTVLVRGGRAVSFLVFLGHDEPFDDALRAKLTETAASRLEANAA